MTNYKREVCRPSDYKAVEVKSGGGAVKVVAANLQPLPSKHYSTDIDLVIDVDGDVYKLYIEVSGYAPVASTREVASGWEPDWGMDHTESEAHLSIAKAICACLNGVTL